MFQELPPRDELHALRRPRRARFFDAGSWAAIALVSGVITASLLWGYEHALGAGRHVEHARAFAMVTLTTGSAAITAGLSQLATPTARVVVAATLSSAFVLIQTPLAPLLHLEPLHVDDWLLAAATAIPAAALCLLLRRHLSARPTSRAREHEGEGPRAERPGSRLPRPRARLDRLAR